MSNIKKIEQLRERFLPGEIIAEQGSESEGLILLEAGRVRFEHDGKKVGSLELLAEERSIEFLGEISALLAKPVKSTAIAETECSTIRIPIDQLEAMFRLAPSLAIKLAQSLCRKLEAASAAALKKAA